jgi:Raf kinase inhibitor-like YbhB/YbcL family protein
MKRGAVTSLLNVFLISTTIGMAIPFSILIRQNNHTSFNQAGLFTVNQNPSNSKSTLMKTSTTETATLTISSTAFSADGNIPLKYSCEGENVNPPLSIRNVPDNAKSLALVLDDPEATHGTFTHWVVWNIPVGIETINENSNPGTEGKNGSGKTGYTGPCPPTGTHHYHFKVYALDVMLNLKKGEDKTALDAAMKSHIIATGEIIGLYKKSK